MSEKKQTLEEFAEDGPGIVQPILDADGKVMEYVSLDDIDVPPAE